MGFLAVCLGLAGCSNLGKKTSLPKPARDDRPAAAGPRDDGPPAPAPAPAAPAGDTGGLVAGCVMDYFDNKTPSKIWIIPPGDGQGAPVYQLAETDRYGYFSIANLRPGQPYRLVAQTKDGQYQQAGEVTVRPPNARVVIKVSQGSTPAVPGGGGADAGARPSVGDPIPLPPAGPPPKDPGVYPKQPLPLSGPAEGSAPPIRPENVADKDAAKNRESRPGSIPNPYGPRPPTPPPPWPPRPAPAPASGGGPSLSGPPVAPVGLAPVPSCDKRGNQLYNFALVGLDGQSWEYKRNRAPGSKLTMLDFWGSWCVPCRVTVKSHLNRLNDLYGRQGLEIIGITYEQEPTFTAQVRTATAAVRELGIKYRVLMGCGMTTCPVKNDFGVKGFPTLVLLDDQGQIIWSKEGPPSEPEFDQLKAIIRRELGIR
jgi:thiol-disulfide isomerase/thioredoxin